jgi:hypothetical protein
MIFGKHTWIIQAAYGAWNGSTAMAPATLRYSPVRKPNPVRETITTPLETVG